MWLAVATCMIAVAYSSFKSLISTNSPVATVSTLYSRQAPRFDLYKEKIFIHAGFRNRGIIYPTKAGMSQINRFITVKGSILRHKVNSKTGTKELDYVLQLNYKPCSQILDKRVIEDFQWHEQSRLLAENLGICPEIEGGQEKYFIDSKPQDPPNHMLVLNFYPCSLPNPADCASPEEFQGAEILLSKTKKAFDNSNFEKPLEAVVEFEGINIISPETSKYLFYKVRDNEVWDDTRDFFDTTLRSKSAGYYFDYRDTRKRDPGQLHCQASVLNNPYDISCRPYLALSLESSGEKQVIVRSYPKFFMVLGEIGGTAEILIMVVVLFYTRYNAYYLKRYIKNEVFRVHSSSRLREIFGPGLNFKKNRVFPRGRDFGLDEHNVSQSSVNVGFNGGLSPLSPRKLNLEQRSGKRVGSIDRLLDEEIDKNMSAISLLRRLNELEILTKIFLKAEHKKLLPVVLLNMADRESKSEQESGGICQEGLQLGAILNPDERDMTLEQAYEKISRNEPSNEIERIVDSFILKNAPEFFKRAPQQQKDPPEFSEVEQKFRIIPKEINKLPSLNAKRPPEIHLREPSPSIINPETQNLDLENLTKNHHFTRIGNERPGKPDKTISIVQKGQRDPSEGVFFKRQVNSLRTSNEVRRPRDRLSKAGGYRYKGSTKGKGLIIKKSRGLKEGSALTNNYDHG